MRKLKKLKTRIRGIVYDDIYYIIINYIISYIPMWSIRKVLYRMFGLKIGKGSRIAMRCIILGPQGIEIGCNNVINEYVLLDGRSGLSIGNNNSISMFAKIYSGTHDTYSNDFAYKGNITVIKDNTWIGTGAVIMPNSILRDFTIIGVNSVFKGMSETKGMYRGIPAELFRKRNIDDKYELNYISWFR